MSIASENFFFQFLFKSLFPRAANKIFDIIIRFIFVK